jgi:hypothetical protein
VRLVLDRLWGSAFPNDDSDHGFSQPKPWSTVSNFISDRGDRHLREGPISSPCCTFSEPEPMVKGADKPETIHSEPDQREGTGKSYLAPTQRRARSYPEYSIFKTT